MYSCKNVVHLPISNGDRRVFKRHKAAERCSFNASRRLTTLAHWQSSLTYTFSITLGGTQICQPACCLNTLTAKNVIHVHCVQTLLVFISVQPCVRKRSSDCLCAPDQEQQRRSTQQRAESQHQPAAMRATKTHVARYTWIRSCEP